MNTQFNLEIINILKGLSFSQLQLQDERINLINTINFNDKKIFNNIDRKSIGKIFSNDIINYLIVHRIAASQRQCQYIISLFGTKQPFITYEQFKWYLCNGRSELLDQLQNSMVNHDVFSLNEMQSNFSEIQFAKILEKQIQYYRAIEVLREQLINKNGFNSKLIITAIDKKNQGHINSKALLSFIQKHKICFTIEDFQALGRKIHSQNKYLFTYKQFIKAFTCFEPLNFPTYRKQSNIQKAMQYIGQQVNLLQIDTQQLPDIQNEQIINKNSTGFQRVMNEYRNDAKNTNPTSQYFYDKNYYNQMKQYKTTFFDPNKDIKKKIQNNMVGPQYHDHFFSDYYMYLEERNKTQQYFNKFGKKYVVQKKNNRSKTDNLIKTSY